MAGCCGRDPGTDCRGVAIKAMIAGLLVPVLNQHVTFLRRADGRENGNRVFSSMAEVTRSSMSNIGVTSIQSPKIENLDHACSRSLICSEKKWAKSLTCLVVGNGAPHPVSEVPTDIYITFNGREPPTPVKWHLDVASHRGDDSVSSQILITGEGPDGFVDKLHETGCSMTKLYEPALGCPPSSGFTIIHALWELGVAVQVRNICFDPSLRRERHLNSRAAPPCMYHNWLGERRLSFARWLTAPPDTWDWPLMRASMTPHPHSPQFLPSSALLTTLTNAQQSKRLVDLTKILSVPFRYDPEYISVNNSDARAIEKCFHLARGVCETSNWWLYDDRGAVIIDALAQRIRTCQSTLFAAALRCQTTPAG